MKLIVFSVVIFISGYLHASFLKSLKTMCVNAFVQDDPHPFAEHSNDDLIFEYRVTRATQAGKEIVYRIRHGLMEYSPDFYYLIEGEE